MLVNVKFNMFDYSQELEVYNDKGDLVTTNYAPIDSLPKRIVETCHTFNAFNVKFNDENFLPKIMEEVSIIESAQYNMNRIKFV